MHLVPPRARPAARAEPDAPILRTSWSRATIELEAFPVNGRLVLTEPKQDDKSGDGTTDADTSEAPAKEGT